MIYLLAIFCSPLALLLAGKPISALFNLILYILSIVLVVTIIFFHIGFSVVAAGIRARRDGDQRRARRSPCATDRQCTAVAAVTSMARRTSAPSRPNGRSRR